MQPLGPMNSIILSSSLGLKNLHFSVIVQAVRVSVSAFALPILGESALDIKLVCICLIAAEQDLYQN